MQSDICLLKLQPSLNRATIARRRCSAHENLKPYCMKSILVKYRRLLFTLAALFGVYVMTGFGVLFILMGEPYVLLMWPSKDGGTVQFLQRQDANTRLTSPIIDVPVLISEEQEIVLKSRDTIVPHGTVEFVDTTLLPGRFRIRFGDLELDVMEARILVNGGNREWIDNANNP